MAAGSSQRVAEASAGRDVARRQLQRFDACLDLLETAHLRGATRLGAGLAGALGPAVPGIHPGMLISNAIDAVLSAQKVHLIRLPGDDGLDAEPAEPRRTRTGAPAFRVLADRTPRVDAAAARALTEQLRASPRNAWLLLAEAHEGRAWIALGHPSWESWVRFEVGISRSRSYELLDQATVIRAVQAAAGIAEGFELSAYAASQLKPCLDRVCDEIRRRTAMLPSHLVPREVDEVIREARATVRVRRASPGRTRSAAPSHRLRELRQAIALLGNQRDVEDAFAGLGHVERQSLAGQAAAAARWLDALAVACP